MGLLRRYKRSIIIATLTLIVALISYIYISQYVLGNNTENLYEVVDSSGELERIYSSVEELKNDAEFMVDIRVNSTQSLQYKEVVFTLSEVNVNQVYSGMLNTKNITILETGGIYNNRNHTFNGNEALKTGDEAVLFIKKYEGPVAQDVYVILGVYQGKFSLKDGDEIIPSKEVMPGLESLRKKSDLILE